MAKHGKKYRKVTENLSADKLFELTEAVEFLKKNAYAKFDETAEIAFRLGVDPSKSDQAVRGSVSLPHGSGKDIRVVVFASGPAADAAREAGADEVGFQEVIDKVKGGWVDFDIAIATTDAMAEVRKLGKVLGPRGLMPNPRNGTVTEDTAAAVKQFKAGRVEFKMDKAGNVNIPFGKLSFETAMLEENGKAVIASVMAAKPNAIKGVYVKKCTVSSTMGPGLPLEARELNT
ncbi:MAG: 50S ribosomal protein L1 [Verrucomicrobia bacterium]|nr:50S ribosomal protein L1 [Verrucomicrobiota bacterium]MCH8513459.1 50S ribosomal protein L1 [Kiritimatiellia bacterium]